MQVHGESIKIHGLEFITVLASKEEVNCGVGWGLKYREYSTLSVLAH